ncbi:hypothetical protein NKH86_20785 [Mesorhizobium sp. M0913]|uniref:hypothetical protein n=1 Tax=Mesorhizobium sp. M0913 TaxID=2957026 RepID=UPI0033363E4C
MRKKGGIGVVARLLRIYSLPAPRIASWDYPAWQPEFKPGEFTGALRADNDNTRFRGGMRAVHWPAKEDPAAALAVLQEIRDTTGQTRTEGAQGHLNPRDANPDDAETHDVPGDEVTSETMVEPAQDGLDEVWPEVLHQIRPSERDICRGVGLD